MTPPRVSRLRDHWHSFSWRLVAAISLLAAFMLAVVVWFAYREVNAALASAASERARAGATQVADLLESAARAGVAQVRLSAAHPAIRASALTRAPELHAEAEQELRVPANGSRPRTVTLWGRDAAKIAEIAVPDPSAGAQVVPWQSGPPPQVDGISPFRRANSFVYFDVAATVADNFPTLNPLGFLVLRSAINTSAAEAIGRLVGSNARVIVGNADGSLWFNIATGEIVTGRPAQSLEGAQVGVDDRLDATAAVRDTPWVVWVDFEVAAVRAPARQFLRRMLGLGTAFGVAGVLLVAILLRRLTKPLGELTAATEAVAAGDYTRKVGTARHDEIGRLGRAFDSMTATIANDVTAREQAAHRLQSNEDRLRYTLGAARVGTWQMDLRSLEVEFSETMAPLFGLEMPQLPTSQDGVLALIHPDDRAAVTACMAREAADRREHEIQFRALQPDGSYKWALGRSRLLADASGATRILGVCFDISEQRHLEEQLQQSQKMDAIGKLAGGVAHDFNNLLTAILGYANFVLDSLEPGDQRRMHVEEILTAGRRAADLTAQLLAFSRKQLLQPAIVDINTTVKESMKLLGRLIGEHIEMETALSTDVGQVRADPVQLQQIVMNLAINARDAMPEGGRLSIETANVDLDESYGTQRFAVKAGSYVMLAVTDTGVGMSEEVRGRMFEPFFTTKERGQGTGLGLATVYGAVKQAGGYIWVYSEPGRGSTFKVYLPRLTGEIASVTVAPLIAPLMSGSETVLLVEDEEAVRILSRMILSRAGYRVIEAANGREAEARHLEFSGLITLVITDVVLPGSSGPELFQRLALRDPRLKVLYMSGYTDDAVFRTGRLQRGVAFIQKPFTAEGIRRKVREVLDAG